MRGQIRYAVRELKWLLLRLQGVKGMERRTLNRLTHHYTDRSVTELAARTVCVVVMVVIFTKFSAMS